MIGVNRRARKTPRPPPPPPPSRRDDQIDDVVVVYELATRGGGHLPARRPAPPPTSTQYADDDNYNNKIIIIVCDVRVVSLLAASYVDRAATDAGTMADMAATRKTEKYWTLSSAYDTIRYEMLF